VLGHGAGLDGEVVDVATRDVFSAEELARLRGFPEITRAELIRYFTLTGPDEVFLPAHPRAAGTAPGRVLPPGRQTGRRHGGARRR